MRNEVEKIDDLIHRKKIKKVIFIPSKIEIWEIKSNTNNNIYWIDLNKSYCSCKSFYYNFIKKSCYHISAVSIALELNSYEIELCNDNELNNYLNNLIENLMNNNI